MRASILAALVTLITIPAIARDGFYIGAALGSTSVNTGTAGPVEVSGSDYGYKAFAGYRFLKFLAVEGAYTDLGTVEHGGYNIFSTEPQVTITGFHAEGMAMLPLGIADIFAKAGAFNWKANFNQRPSGGAETSKDGTAPLYGAGVQFRIKSWAVRGEIEYFDIKNADHVYMYSVGGSYTF